MKKALSRSFCAGLLAASPVPAVAAASSSEVYDAGQCVVQQDRRAAIALMQSLPLDESPADSSALRGRAARCAGPLSGAPSMLVRGAIAQAMFLRDFGSFRRNPDSETSFINLNLPLQSSPAGSRAVELYRWADCVVRYDTATTERLLRTGVGSPEEGATIGELQNFMAACMPEGAELTVRPWELRSVFAQAAYHTLYRYWTGQLTARGS